MGVVIYLGIYRPAADYGCGLNGTYMEGVVGGAVIRLGDNRCYCIDGEDVHDIAERVLVLGVLRFNLPMIPIIDAGWYTRSFKPDLAPRTSHQYRDIALSPTSTNQVYVWLFQCT